MSEQTTLTPVATPAPGGEPSTSPANTPAAGAQPQIEHAYIPEKFRVVGQDGKLDLQTSAQKLAESYQHAVRRIGSGDMPPAEPGQYEFQPPEHLADLQLPDDEMQSFKEKAHELGLTQAQYQAMLGEYFDRLPQVLKAFAPLSVDDAKGQLAQVWRDPVTLQKNMANAERAVALMPQDLQGEIRKKYATDPTFWRFAAEFGRETGEDRPISSGGSQAPIGDIESVMRSDAYRNAKHPDHARVSALVSQHFEARFGGAQAR